MATLHDFEMKTIDGTLQSLGDYRDRVVLVVNVASECGLTPQYAGLQHLHEAYEKRGLSVLGFPCNQFGGQEPGDEKAIKTFCTTKYGVTFPMFAKVDVNGADQDPFYTWLTTQETKPEHAGDIKWNFGKFLIGKDGRVVARFAPTVAPDAPELTGAIEKALG